MFSLISDNYYHNSKSLKYIENASYKIKINLKKKNH